MKHELIMAVVASAAIYHNGKHYNIGDEIEVTEAEFNELAIYLEPKDEVLQARLQAEAEAQALAQEAEEAAEAEKTALRQAVVEAKEAHARAEALATENGLRADQAEARVAELEQALAEKEAELTACKAKGSRTKADKTEKTEAQ